MTTEIKQSTAHTFKLGPFLDKTDGVSLETGLATAMDNATTGIRLSKNGGNMADRNDATVPAHDEDGFYTIVLDATDTNTLGALKVEYTEVATCLPAWETFSVVTANYWDTKYGADVFQADLTQMGGVAQSATDLKDFADDGYDPATNKVQGVVLVDTTTTNTDVTALNDVAATDIVSAGAITTLSGAIVNVDLVDLCTTTTTNTDVTALNDVAATDIVSAGAITTSGGAVTTVTTTGTATNVTAVNGFAAGAIDAAAIATDAIDADALATDAVNEISRAIGIQKNAAFSNFQFLMVLTSDHVTPATGLTVTGERSLDAAAFAAVAGTITEVSDGYYQFDALAADTNGDTVVWRFSSATADDSGISFKTVA